MQKKYKQIIKQIKKYDNIIITGHKNPDFDSFASSLGMYEICKKYNKNVSIYINTEIIGSTFNKGLILLEKSSNTYNFVDTIDIKISDKKNTLLIVVDFSNSELIENKDLLELDTIVIDHHIIDKKLKIKSIYDYIDGSVSSTSEIITFFLKQLNLKPSTETLTLLLVGIEVDTNGYITKTSFKTFLAASILLELGADNIIKTELLKETREEFFKKTNMIKRSYMINENMMLCILDNKIYEQKSLAEIADELIQFEDVEASFVIGKIANNEVSISSRSIGNIDVQKIMKKLGGGGTPTSSAAKFEASTIKQVKDRLLKIIK